MKITTPFEFIGRSVAKLTSNASGIGAVTNDYSFVGVLITATYIDNKLYACIQMNSSKSDHYEIFEVKKWCEKVIVELSETIIFDNNKVSLFYVDKKSWSKTLLWKVCGEQIFQNCLASCNYQFNVPVKVSNIPDSDTMLPGFFAQNGEFVLDDIAFIPHNLSIIKNSSTSDYQ